MILLPGFFLFDNSFWRSNNWSNVILSFCEAVIC